MVKVTALVISFERGRLPSALGMRGPVHRIPPRGRGLGARGRTKVTDSAAFDHIQVLDYTPLEPGDGRSQHTSIALGRQAPPAVVAIWKTLFAEL